MRNISRGLAVVALCSAAVAGPANAHDHDPKLAEAVAGEWRSESDRARDTARHPAETLGFWGLAPGMAVLEVQPGGGWWTEIIAPYTRMTGGRYFVTGPDAADPELSERGRDFRAKMEADYAARKDQFGEVGIVNWGSRSAPPPADTFDLAIVSRSVHGWMREEGRTEKALKDLYVGLKPGGILGIEQHRANADTADIGPKSGYVLEDWVIEQAEKAGFKLIGRSEINANPRDTKDHPFGVWTLPPARRSTAYGSGSDTDPDFDHSKYDAIGESDRMTLRFQKPE